MSDSDSDFELDFITGAAGKIRGELKSARSNSKFDLASVVSKSEVDHIRPPEPPIVKVVEPELQVDIVRSKDVENENSTNFNITPPSTPNSSTKKRGRRRGQMQKKRKTAKTSRTKLPKFGDDSDTSIIDIDDEDEKTDEEENCFIKIRWRHEIMRFPVKQNDRLGHLFDRFAQEVNVDISSISFSTDNKVLERTDTMVSRNFTVASIIDAKKICNNEVVKIELKFQTADKKKVQTILCKPFDTFGTLMEMYAKLTQTDANKLKFVFDGDKVDLKSTPEDLDLEGGECIDVY